MAEVTLQSQAKRAYGVFISSSDSCYIDPSSEKESFYPFLVLIVFFLFYFKVSKPPLQPKGTQGFV